MYTFHPPRMRLSSVVWYRFDFSAFNSKTEGFRRLETILNRNWSFASITTNSRRLFGNVLSDVKVHKAVNYLRGLFLRDRELSIVASRRWAQISEASSAAFEVLNPELPGTSKMVGHLLQIAFDDISTSGPG